MSNQPLSVRTSKRRLCFEPLESRRLLTAFALQFNATFPLYNTDAIANYTDGSVDLGDSAGSGSELFVTESYAAQHSSNGNGLPDDGLFPAGQYHPAIRFDYRVQPNDDNVAQLDAGELFATNHPGDFSFKRMHFLAASVGGSTLFEVQLNYRSGPSTYLRSTSPDWLATIVEGSQEGDATLYTLIDDMDTYDGGYIDSNNAAVFGHSFPVDPARPMASLFVRALYQDTPETKLNVFGITMETSLDFGDISKGNYLTKRLEDGARHVVGGPHLGATVDSEPEGGGASTCCPLRDANSDADDDGIEFAADGLLTPTTHTVPGRPTLPLIGIGDNRIRVTLANADPVQNYLDGWIDWNRDGDFLDVGEQVFSSRELGPASGEQFLSIVGPSDLDPGPSYARFRVSTTTGLASYGLALDGEVEDYQIELRQDGNHFSSLVGVDFDDAQGNTPDHWNQISGFSRTGQVFDNLIAENRFTSPYTLTLSATTASDPVGQPMPIADPTFVPDHQPSLEWLDGNIATTSAEAGQFIAEWSGLHPGAPYDVYVFTLDDKSNSLAIDASGVKPTATVEATLLPGELWANGQRGSDDQPLSPNRMKVIADADGKITISTTSSIQWNAMAGLAIQQRNYSGPRVAFATPSPGGNVYPSEDFIYRVVIDSQLMGPIGPEDVELQGANSGSHTVDSISVTYPMGLTVYSFHYSNLPSDDYTITLLSGDGQFEDTLGADLDGEILYGIHNGDGSPGGDRVYEFTIGNPWHNLALAADVNGDGAENISDLRLTFSYFFTAIQSALPPNGASSTLMVDINNDTYLTIADVRLVFVAVTSAGENEGEAEHESLAAPMPSLQEERDRLDERRDFAWATLKHDWWRSLG